MLMLITMNIEIGKTIFSASASWQSEENNVSESLKHFRVSNPLQ